MRRHKSFVAIAAVLFCGLMAREVSADETDNFTCRSRPMRDALEQLDALMNARIREAVARANHRAGARCDAACLERVAVDELRDAIGSSYRPLPMLIPHSRFMKSVSDLPDLDRCHLKFSETIYGARSYNRPWMYPFHRRIIFVADSIHLANRIVGLDKMNHFIREGLVHWRAVNEKGSTIASDIARELGSPSQHTAWTEQGLKGMALTGVLAYADLAASYSGFRFWSDLLAVGTPQSIVELDRATGRLHQIRAFTFAAYVNDAWDETINRSKLEPKLRQEVDEIIRRRGLSPGGDCRHLAALPDASLFVNPECLAAANAATRTAMVVDFSGRWVLVSATPARPGYEQFWLGTEATITQTPSSLSVRRLTPLPQREARFALDGDESQNEYVVNGQGLLRSSRVTWNGDTLLISTDTALPDGQTYLSNILRWSLDAGGMLVIGDTEICGRGECPSVLTTVKFKKAD